MEPSSEHQLNQDAYLTMRDFIRQQYPREWFVAISGGQIIADAATFQLLRTLLVALGKEPTEVLVVQAGIEYPEKAVIF